MLGLIMVTGIIAKTTPKKQYPKNLYEAITHLDKRYSKSYKQDIYNMTENEYITKSHFSTGLWMRYKWGLTQGSKLSKYFNDLGIYHPYDMSSIIFHCYYRHIHFQDYELSTLVKYYQDRRKKPQESM